MKFHDFLDCILSDQEFVLLIHEPFSQEEPELKFTGKKNQMDNFTKNYYSTCEIESISATNGNIINVVCYTNRW